MILLVKTWALDEPVVPTRSSSLELIGTDIDTIRTWSWISINVGLRRDICLPVSNCLASELEMEIGASGIEGRIDEVRVGHLISRSHHRGVCSAEVDIVAPDEIVHCPDIERFFAGLTVEDIVDESYVGRRAYP